MAKKSASAIRREKLARQKAQRSLKGKAEEGTLEKQAQTKTEIKTKDNPPNDIETDEIEYVPAPIVEDVDAVLFESFGSVLKRYNPLPNTSTEDEDEEGCEKESTGIMAGDEDLNGSESEEKLSRRKSKKLKQMKLAELKLFAPHPEVVEWEDVTAKDPKFFVLLKCVRHSVPVPPHWIQKRRYLSGKRGYVKPPFELPAYIRDTGITELRDGMRAADATKRIKVKAREKMHPKLGKLSVDYERLYDAFFKYQTKPKLSGHGDLYFEGKEFMAATMGKRVGVLSEETREALGMTNALMPPPWLHAQQKYGPPPSYLNIKIAGLNHPIPDGAQWGYHPGGWGKPPQTSFDEHEGGSGADPIEELFLHKPQRDLWGELEPEEDEDE